ncbi:MAG: OB-fold nucleic acid binding domain-containing protein [bacterium]|nr:OB-fold nucleic acid binding domain-containing protein [bacterium]
MQEKTLIKLSLVTSVVGVIALFIISFFVKYDLIAITDINEDFVGKTIRIEGQIISLRQMENTYIFELQDETGVIPVIAYTEEQINLEKNSFVEVTGIISMYTCKLELKAEKVILQNF